MQGKERIQTASVIIHYRHIVYMYTEERKGIMKLAVGQVKEMYIAHACTLYS